MNARTARVIEVIEVVTYEGAGTPDDVGREVTRYFSTEGNWLATYDPQEHRVTFGDVNARSITARVRA